MCISPAVVQYGIVNQSALFSSHGLDPGYTALFCLSESNDDSTTDGSNNLQSKVLWQS